MNKEIANFVNTYGLACGGNWVAMMQSSICNYNPSLEDQLESELEALNDGFAQFDHCCAVISSILHP